MRLGYDARPVVSRWTGMRTYTVNLVRQLVRLAPTAEVWLYFHTGEPDTALPPRPNLWWRQVRAVNGWWWTLFQMPVALRKDGVVLFHADYIVPPLAPCPTVVTMHDAISAMFLEPANLRVRLVTNILSFLSVHKSKAIFVPSETAKSDVARLFFVPSGKIIVTPYGVSEQFSSMPKHEAKGKVSERFGINGRFILTVNFFRPRKNAVMLAIAFRELLRRKVPIDWLVFVGVAPQQMVDKIKSAAGDAINQLVFTGYVADDDLPLLYNAADVFAFPSRYEGFGLPVLEAMACGTPVVAGDTPAVNEISKGDALLVPTNDWKPLADALEEVLTNEILADFLTKQGLNRAVQFSWERTAQLTLSVYETVVNGYNL